MYLQEPGGQDTGHMGAPHFLKHSRKMGKVHTGSNVAIDVCLGIGVKLSLCLFFVD